MGKGLAGKRVGIGGSRKTEEISALIQKQGGEASVRSLQGTVFLAEREVEPEMQTFINEGADWIIFTTGIGIESLFSLSEKLNVKEAFLQRIIEANVAARGYKSFAVLKKAGIVPVAVDDDGTTRGLIRALENEDFRGKKVVIQLHGDPAPALTKFFKDQGSIVSTILPYRHIPPEQESVKKLCSELMEHQFDAFCFTTAVQVRSLFTYGREFGITSQLLNAFNGPVMAVAVGKVTAEALFEEGVEKYLVPENERMGAMIVELSRYYENA
ncbi:uroporphyrinogen-III synthase [Peribacillus deserti]|uniref:Uroporphyrinogen-III synthase n=1 Tax=Peribacillus deserti TaxID=673318 RepID=A0ABS2QDS8_9BACI|nr:uroporphyrinogen-III synthase [Peribacillus deserti]MBM7691288.1 uroporphyrinogen-III synthase [Peribacillus deserti]